MSHFRLRTRLSVVLMMVLVYQLGFGLIHAKHDFIRLVLIRLIQALPLGLGACVTLAILDKYHSRRSSGLRVYVLCIAAVLTGSLYLWVTRLFSRPFLGIAPDSFSVSDYLLGGLGAAVVLILAVLAALDRPWRVVQQAKV